MFLPFPPVSESLCYQLYTVVVGIWISPLVAAFQLNRSLSRHWRRSQVQQATSCLTWWRRLQTKKLAGKQKKKPRERSDSDAHKMPISHSFAKSNFASDAPESSSSSSSSAAMPSHCAGRFSRNSRSLSYSCPNTPFCVRTAHGFTSSSFERLAESRSRETTEAANELMRSLAEEGEDDGEVLKCWFPHFNFARLRTWSSKKASVEKQRRAHTKNTYLKLEATPAKVTLPRWYCAYLSLGFPKWLGRFLCCLAVEFEFKDTKKRVIPEHERAKSQPEGS